MENAMLVLVEDNPNLSLTRQIGWTYPSGIMNQAIAIDIGTSKISLVQFDISSMQVIHAASEGNNSLVSLPDHHKHEQDPERIWSIIQGLLKQFPSRSSVEFVTITGQVHGILLVDDAFKPMTNLMTWRDSRNRTNPVGSNHKLQNGCLVQKGYGGSTLKVLLEEGELVVNDDVRVCTITSFVMGRLCGCYAIDESIAATLGVYDIRNRRWNAAQLEELGIPLSLFPPVVPSSAVMGTMLPSVALDLGLKETVAVCSPIGDNQASFIGSLGFCPAGLINIGTGGQVSVPCTEITDNPSIEIRPLPEDGYMQVYSSLCGGWAYSYLKDFCKDVLASFGASVTDRAIYEKLDQLALDADPLHALLVDTQFLGVREVPDTFGKISHIDTSNFTLGNLTRAFLEGIVRELHPPQIRTESMEFLVASGNAVRKSPLMVALIQAEFGCPVKIAPFLEEASIGSVLSSAVLFEDTQIRERIHSFYTTHFNR